jgi:membrane protein DedA with SNARE-associated domain
LLTSLAHWVQDQVAAHGLSAVFGLMVLESACIPVPSEVTMIYAGYLVSKGSMVFWQAVVVGAFANLVGSWIAWAAGAYGVDEVILRGEHNRRRVDQAHRWFERYGTPVVFFTRMMPLIRTFISLPAGVARMPLGRFSALTFVGCLPWCLMLVWVGDAAGANWDTWHRRIGYLDYVVVAAVVCAASWWLLRRRRRAAV